MDDNDTGAPSPPQTQAPKRSNGAKKGKRSKPADSGKSAARPEDTSGEVMAELHEIALDVQSMRRKVAHEADINRVEQRLSVVEDKIEYIAQTVHTLHCLLEGMQQAAQTQQYMGGY